MLHVDAPALDGDAVHAAINAGVAVGGLDSLAERSQAVVPEGLVMRVACAAAGGAGEAEAAARSLIVGQTRAGTAADVAARCLAVLTAQTPTRVATAAGPAPGRAGLSDAHAAPSAVVESALRAAGHATERAASIATAARAIDDLRPAPHGIVIAALGAGVIVGAGPVTGQSTRAMGLAGAMLLATTGCLGGPWAAPAHLDAASRSAAVQLERSGAWTAWVRAWCGQLARECARTQAAVDALNKRFDNDRVAVREQPRVGATDERVLAWMQARLRCTIREASAALDLTTPTIGASVARLEASGLTVELTGQFRDRVWVTRATLDLIAGA